AEAKVAAHAPAFPQPRRGALAVTVTTAAGVQVRALTAHLKSKLLSFPGGRVDTRDETERSRYALDALNRPAAEAAALRDWTPAALADAWAARPILVGG